MQAKGKGAKAKRAPAASHTSPGQAADATGVGGKLTSYDVFRLCIERAKNLIKLHKAAHGKQAKPEKYMADAHRAAIVLAVSALDAFVRTFIITRTRVLLARKDQVLPNSLRDRIKRFLKEDDLLDAARKDDLLDRVERAFTNDFSRRSFQGTKNIAEYMQLVGYDNIFHEVAMKAGVNEDTLCADLNKFTERRHLIAHRGDYDLNENPPKQNLVTKKDAEECIKTVDLVAKCMYELGGTNEPSPHSYIRSQDSGPELRSTTQAHQELQQLGPTWRLILSHSL